MNCNNKYITLYSRKNIYGGKGWAFDCDKDGNIIGDMMQKGYDELIKNCYDYIDTHKLSIKVTDMFNVFGEIRSTNNGMIT